MKIIWTLELIEGLKVLGETEKYNLFKGKKNQQNISEKHPMADILYKDFKTDVLKMLKATKAGAE